MPARPSTYEPFSSHPCDARSPNFRVVVAHDALTRDRVLSWAQIPSGIVCAVSPWGAHASPCSEINFLKLILSGSYLGLCDLSGTF